MKPLLYISVILLLSSCGDDPVETERDEYEREMYKARDELRSCANGRERADKVLKCLYLKADSMPVASALFECNREVE